MIPQGERRTKLEIKHEGVLNFANLGDDFKYDNFVQGWKELIGTNLRNFLYLIERLHFSININASRQKVWQTLWDKNSYSEWTSPCCAGSFYAGLLQQGERIHFLMPNGNGMYSTVLFLDPEKTIVFKHLGEVVDHKELPINSETEHWTGCIESYKLYEITPTTTEVVVEVDVVNSHLEFMKSQFPLAIEKLKELAEK